MRRRAINFLPRGSSELLIPLFLLKKIFANSILILIFLLSQRNSINAQWKKIFDFGDEVNTIYFKDFTTTPLDGFVSIDSTQGFGAVSGVKSNKVWRTMDGGFTWHQANYPPDSYGNNKGRYPTPGCFTFKDQKEGWFCGHFGSYDLYRTTDGGDVWYPLLVNQGAASIYFNHRNGRLFCVDGISLKFSDDGVNFTSFQITEGSIAVAFSDDIHGVISGGNFAARTPPTLMYTIDGGYTWNPSSQVGEQYGPIGISNSETFFMMPEQGLSSLQPTGCLLKSNDGGANWEKVYQYNLSTDIFSVTGTLQYNSNALFFQTTKDNSEGIMMSVDSGNSFHSICGPINDIDTRFYVRDSFIYAGDKYGGLWLNTTGIGSNSTPQLSVTKITAPALLQCQTFDSLISFTFFDSCANTQAKLASASITGSNNFSFSSPSAIPRTIHPNDSLIISYNPQTSQPDTAQLHLRFHLGWKDFDTVISLFGAGRIPKENVKFIPSLSKSVASAGSDVHLFVFPDKVISGRDLQSISFDLHYNADLLDERSRTASTSIPGAVITLGIETPSPSVETRHGASLPVTITGNDLALDLRYPIADVKFQAMLTDTTSTSIRMTNLKLNNGDSVYANCILSADSSNTNFTLLFLCGDSTLYKYLRTGKVLDIISIRPNPAQDEIEIDLQSAMKQDALVEIFDALGAKVFSDVRSVVAGSNSIHLAMKSLSGGMYLVRVGGVSQSFVKVR